MEQGNSRYRALIVLCSVISLVVGGVIGYFSRPQPAPPITISTPVPSPTATPAPLRVHVSGAVLNPDVYVLPPGSIVRDAVMAAGGPAPDADLERINLAVELHDQQQVRVPRKGEETASDSGAASGGSEETSGLININTATAAQLETLPRIGPAMAQRIVEYREANGPFKTVEELQNVPGIGPATFEGLKDLITVGP
ncbi:MAG: helix-hairpin-helix domain-containing protein [Anaerolineae bacterium]|nr:helix-hairpin-helix domain-containing protein [Anaerolineae bacterium]